MLRAILFLLAAVLPGTPGERRDAVATTPVAAYAQTVAWSRFDRGAGYYVLELGNGRGARDLPAEGDGGPIDADVGPDASARPALVASDRGRIVLVDPGSGRSHFLTRPPHGARDGHPTLWRSHVSWVRARGGRQQVLVTGRRRAVRGLVGRGETVEALELRGRLLAAVVTDGGDVGTLRLADLADGRVRDVQQVGSGIGGQTILGPSFSGGRLRWYLSCLGDPAGCDGRGGAWSFDTATGDYTRSPDPRTLDGYAVASPTLAYAARHGGGGDRCPTSDEVDESSGCTIVRVPVRAGTPVPAQRGQRP